MATQVAERRENPIMVIRQTLTTMAPEFKAALPAHVSVEKFTRVAQTAIQNNPDLMSVDRKSLFGAIVRLAQDGLLPDGREAAIVKFGNAAQAMPMIAGVLKKIRQSGDVAKISAQVVYENDHFLVKYGFDEDVEHTPPPLDKPRGKEIGAYATAVLKDGTQLLEVMSREEIEKVRAVSRAKGNGPWVSWWGEMARKTVMRRLSKRLPMSTDLEEEVFQRDETMRPTGDAPTMRVVEHQEPPEPTSRLDALEQHIEDGEFSEGPDVSQTGEGFTDDEPYAATVTQLKAMIGAISDAASFDDAKAEYLLHSDALPKSVCDEIEALLAEKAAGVTITETKMVVLIRDLFGVLVTDLDAPLPNAAHLDSLDMIELVMETEEKFSVDITDDEADPFTRLSGGKTVRQWCALVDEKLGVPA